MYRTKIRCGHVIKTAPQSANQADGSLIHVGETEIHIIRKYKHVFMLRASRPELTHRSISKYSFGGNLRHATHPAKPLVILSWDTNMPFSTGTQLNTVAYSEYSVPQQLL